MTDTYEGLHVIINNKKGWKYYGNCSGRWIEISKRQIGLNQGSTPISVISVKENGIELREYKLKLIWESVNKKQITKITDDCMEGLHEYDPDIMDIDGDPDIMDIDGDSYHPSNREFSDYTKLEFAISDQTGISCHTTSLHCREGQKLIETNVSVETPSENGLISGLKNEYQIEIKFGFTFMDHVLHCVD